MENVHAGMLGLGLALGNVTSLFNHSCVPNAYWRANADTGKLEIWSSRTISRGESIRISYGVDGTRKERQERLQSSYGFTCQCELCQMQQ
jgi:SET and MYND domain-containing protein